MTDEELKQLADGVASLAERLTVVERDLQTLASCVQGLGESTRFVTSDHKSHIQAIIQAISELQEIRTREREQFYDSLIYRAEQTQRRPM